MLDSFVSTASAISKVIATVFTAIFNELIYFVVISVVLFFVGKFLYGFLKNHWATSEPNQWLLVIRNGVLYKSGIGLKTWIGFTDTIVRFPSKIQKVSFSANNVTKQMQGVQIAGFAFWSVYRQDEGPFKCYKYMQGGDPNSNVRALCESSLRNLIANSTLEQVLRNRNLLRKKMSQDLLILFRGWGVYLQSVQITEVKISSDRLFNDLQAQFRQDVRFKAETIEIQSQQQMQSARQGSQMKISELIQGNNTKKAETRNNQELRRRQLNSDFEDKKNELEIKRLQRQNKFQLSRLSNSLEMQTSKLNNQQKIRDMNNQFEFSFLKKKLDLDKLHDQKTLKIYQINTMSSIYEKLPIKEIKINQFSGQSKTNLSSLLPAIGLAQM